MPTGTLQGGGDSSLAPIAGLRDYTRGWEGDDRVVPGGPPVFEAALAGLLQGTEWPDGPWHGHRRGGAAAAWARGPPGAWFLSFGRWEDKRTAMGYVKDFQDPRVLGDLLLPWPGKGGTLEFRDLAASQVWAGVQFASEWLGEGGGRGGLFFLLSFVLFVFNLHCCHFRLTRTKGN